MLWRHTETHTQHIQSSPTCTPTKAPPSPTDEKECSIISGSGREERGAAISDHILRCSNLPPSQLARPRLLWFYNSFPCFCFLYIMKCTFESDSFGLLCWPHLKHKTSSFRASKAHIASFSLFVPLCFVFLPLFWFALVTFVLYVLMSSYSLDLLWHQYSSNIPILLCFPCLHFAFFSCDRTVAPFLALIIATGTVANLQGLDFLGFVLNSEPFFPWTSRMNTLLATY